MARRIDIWKKGLVPAVLAAGVLLFNSGALAQAPPLSEATEGCLMCHEEATPGIVADWRNSLHAKTSFTMAAAAPERSRKVSSLAPEGELAEVAVGCAECHTLNPDTHKDTFNHEGFQVHIVVSPKDCAVCHARQTDEYSRNKMGNAHRILVDNPLYMTMVNAINGPPVIKDGKPVTTAADELTNAESCLACHGTEVKVNGTQVRETDFGDLEFPVLEGWPSQGVGRINPDMSAGACTACHPRHGFDMTTARKPYTCSQCHKGPDAPAYNIYSVSKHGNIQASQDKDWDYTQKPWVAGRDFNAPTCAVCHASGVEDANGNVLAESTHQMNDRLPWRLFGVIYSHPQPKEADTTVIRNKEGQPMATSLDGEWAKDFLIDEAAREERKNAMLGVCAGCHSRQWAEGHWKRMENTLQTSDAMVKAATDVMEEAWNKKYAQADNLFDESIERKWMLQWLFYANSTRKASAMAGADYGVFAGGRWDMSKNLADMAQWLETQKKSQ
ncbi:multiheme c-type cytochrome [Desulfatibacillum aliphaticivorans]|uniref:multiheme c-type cytochrome n=1 Tax=Desulfatibacillum aliphaticivorans TaxID=218208 RepID=UPI0003FC5174|nr:multiheme c-type cytochrome [Desulfatibacillum aliphaticivorans]